MLDDLFHWYVSTAARDGSRFQVPLCPMPDAESRTPPGNRPVQHKFLASVAIGVTTFCLLSKLTLMASHRDRALLPGGSSFPPANREDQRSREMAFRKAFFASWFFCF